MDEALSEMKRRMQQQQAKGVEEGSKGGQEWNYQERINVID